MKLARLLILLVMFSSLAHADRLVLHGFGEGALGVGIPAGDSNYRNFASPTFVFSLRGGVELWLFRHLGFAPELEFDAIPVKTNDGTYRSLTINGSPCCVDTPFTRVRFLVGGRFLFDFGIGAAYARFLIGGDYLTGSERASIGPVNISANFSSTAFTLQPGVGIQFRFLRYGIAGFALDFPVSFFDFGRKDAAGLQSFDAVDVDLLGTIGFRI